MKLNFSLFILSALALAACDIRSKRPKVDTISVEEMESVGAFHSPFKSEGKSSYSAEMLIEIKGDVLTRTTLHPKNRDTSVLEPAVKVVQEYRIEKKFKMIRLTQLLRSTYDCPILKLTDDSKTTLGFKKSDDNQFTMILAQGQISGLTKASAEDIERIKATPECRKETEAATK